MRRALAAALVLAAACSRPGIRPLGPETFKDATITTSGALMSGLAVMTRIERIDGRPAGPGTLPPGDRVVVARVELVKAATLEEGAAKRGEAYYSELPIRAALKPGRAYVLRGELNSKFCLAWIEDKETGKKASIVESTFYVRHRAQGDTSLALTTVEAALKLLGVRVP